MGLRRTIISVASAIAVVGVTAFLSRPMPARSAPGDVIHDIEPARVAATGWPLAITRAGHYRLLGDLVVPPGADALQVADGLTVTIDLNGFQIVGASHCTAQLPCPAPAGTSGVRVLGPNSQVTVMNGRIRGFSHAALSATAELPMSGRFTAMDLHLENNGAGVRAAALNATRLVASGNQRLGVYATQLTVSDSRFYDNGQCGVSGVQGVVQRSIAVGNTGYGFCGALAVVFQSNAAWGNGQGAVLGGASVVASNTF